jgi:anti-sigma factor RsiW
MSARDPNELLSAYVDGVGELTTDERKIVEARLADDPAWRDEADATRSLLGQLRELPDEGAEPDWSAMERAIRDEVGPVVPRPWWRGWRWLVPIGALAMAGAVLLLVLRAPEKSTDVGVTTPVLRDAGVPLAAPEHPGSGAEPTTVPLWLDGAAVEVDLQAADLLDDEEPTDQAELGLLPTDDLAWVDDLGDDDMAAAEAWLARKKS